MEMCATNGSRLGNEKVCKLIIEVFMVCFTLIFNIACALVPFRQT